MHQDAATGVVARTSLVVGTGDADSRLAHRLDVFSLVRKLGCVVKHKNPAVRRCHSIACCLKVAGEDLGLVDSIIVEKSVRGFSIRPVLASQRNTLAGTCRELLEQRSETLAQPLVLEIAMGKFAINPIVIRPRLGNTLPSARSNMFARHAAPRVSRTRNIRISCGRIRCKINLQPTNCIQEVVGNWKSVNYGAMLGSHGSPLGSRRRTDASMIHAIVDNAPISCTCPQIDQITATSAIDGCLERKNST